MAELVPPVEPRRVLLGVTGSIAAYKAPEIVRRLQDDGCVVRVVMTESARHVIGAATFEAITGHPCMGPFWAEHGSGEIEHIAWGDWADCFVIAPATADCIAKLRLGIADTPLLATALAARCPLVIAPAMNCNMWASVPIREHVAALAERGVSFVGPSEGSLACGWEGAGRLADVDAIVAAVRAAGEAAPLMPKTLEGHHFVVTLGPTREAIDPVRFISNRSSGKMGCAVIEAALARGATVTAIHGPLATPLPRGGVTPVSVESAEQMDQALHRVVFAEQPPSVVIMTAAVADFRPRRPSPEKIKRAGLGDAVPALELEANPDIIAGIARRRGAHRKPLLVGFAVETLPHGDALIAELVRKRRAKGVELLVGNRGEDAFDHDTNTAYLIDESRPVEQIAGSKAEVADAIIDRVQALIGKGARRE